MIYTHDAYPKYIFTYKEIVAFRFFGQCDF